MGHQLWLYKYLNVQAISTGPSQVQNDLEHPILVILHFFQSFPSEVVQNDGMPKFGHFTLFPIFPHQGGLK